MQIEVHRDMDASFQPAIVEKRQRRLTGVDQIVLSLSAELDNPRFRAQGCIIHLIRTTFRYASRKYWAQIAHHLRPVYTAATEADAWARF